MHREKRNADLRSLRINLVVRSRWGFGYGVGFHGSRSTQPTTLPTAIGLWGEVGQDARPTGIGVPLEWKVRVLDGRGDPVPTEKPVDFEYMAACVI